MSQNIVTVYVNDGCMNASTSRSFLLDNEITMESLHEMLRVKFKLGDNLPVQLYIIHQSPDGRVFADFVSSISQLFNTECILCLGNEPLLIPQSCQAFPSLYDNNSLSMPLFDPAVNDNDQPSSTTALIPYGDMGSNPQQQQPFTNYPERQPDESWPKKKTIKDLAAQFNLSPEQTYALEDYDSWHALQMKYYKKSKVLLSALQLCGRADPKASRLGLLESVHTYEEFMDLAGKHNWKTKNMNGAFIRHQLFAEAHAIDPLFLYRWENVKLEPGQNRQTMAAQAARDLLAQRNHPLGIGAPGGRRSKAAAALLVPKERVTTRKNRRKPSESDHTEDEGERAKQGISILSEVAEASMASENTTSVRRGKRPSFYRTAEDSPHASSTTSPPLAGPSISSPSHPISLVKTDGEHINLCVALTNTLDPIEFLCELGKEALSRFLLEKGFVPGTSLKHLASTLFLYWVRCSCPLARRHLVSLGASLQDLSLAVPPSSSSSSASLYQAMSDLQTLCLISGHDQPPSRVRQI